MAIGVLAALCLALRVGTVEASVLATGTTVDEHPQTVVASAVLLEPRRLVVDVVPHPSAPVMAEWTVLCGGGPGPVTGGEYSGRGPLHRRSELPPRPRGLCIVEVEAKFVDAEQSGRIAVRLRGRAKRPPVDL